MADSEFEQSIRSFDHGYHDEHVWYWSSYSFVFPSRTSCVPSRILHGSLLCIFVLCVALNDGSFHHSAPNPGAGCHYLLLDIIPLILLDLLPQFVCSCDEQYSTCCPCWLLRGRSQTGTRNAAHLVRPSDAVLRFLCGTRAHACLAPMGTILVRFNLCRSHRIEG